MTAPPPKLSLIGLGKSFGTTVAVADVSLLLQPGEFVSLLGPSGCGKTTTLRMIAGFIKPTTGRIEVDRQVVSSPTGVVAPEKRGMSMIFQSYAIWPNMTVGQNVAFGLKLRRLSRHDVDSRVTRILDVVRLGHLRDRYPAELSGGQQQRVALARAIVIEPEVLLLDEPLSNLDANLREEMRSEIRRLHDAFQITTVYVTHDQAEALVTSDRIVVMNQGRIEQVDDPVAIYTRPKTRFVAKFIGRTNLLDGQRQGDRLVFPGFTVPFDGIRDPGASSFAIRPGAIHLHSTQPAAREQQWLFTAVIEQRSYLGEHWDYTILVGDGASRLVTNVPAANAFEVGTRVWATIDVNSISAVPPANDDP